MDIAGEDRPELRDANGHRVSVEGIDSHAIGQGGGPDAGGGDELGARTAIALEDLDPGQGNPLGVALPVDQLVEDRPRWEGQVSGDRELDGCHAWAFRWGWMLGWSRHGIVEAREGRRRRRNQSRLP